MDPGQNVARSRRDTNTNHEVGHCGHQLAATGYGPDTATSHGPDTATGCGPDPAISHGRRGYGSAVTGRLPGGHGPAVTAGCPRARITQPTAWAARANGRPRPEALPTHANPLRGPVNLAFQVLGRAGERPAGRTATLCDVRLIRLRDGGDDSVIRRTAIRLAASAAAVALVPALAGCAAGVNAQTNQPFTPTDGASTVFHNIAIRDVFVLGPRVNGTLQPGQDAGMFLALVNNGAPDQLTAVSAPGTATSVTIHGGTVQLGQAQPALLTGPSPELVLTGLTRPLNGGQSVPMTLTFQNAGHHRDDHPGGAAGELLRDVLASGSEPDPGSDQDLEEPAPVAIRLGPVGDGHADAATPSRTP